MKCVFCDELEIGPRLITENELARAFPTNAPIVAGHTLIASKRHVQYFEELTDVEREAIEDLRKKLHRAMVEAFDAEGFNYAWNEERIGGQSVPHFHLHMLPRKNGDAGVYNYEPREFMYRPIPVEQRPVSSEEELREVARLLRESL